MRRIQLSHLMLTTALCHAVVGGARDGYLGRLLRSGSPAAWPGCDVVGLVARSRSRRPWKGNRGQAVGVARADENREVGSLGGGARPGSRSTPARHDDVEQNDVGVGSVPDRLDRLLPPRGRSSRNSPGSAESPTPRFRTGSSSSTTSTVPLVSGICLPRTGRFPAAWCIGMPSR